MKRFFHLIILLFISAALFLSCSEKSDDPYSDASFGMGTVCTITLYETVKGFDFQEAFDLIDGIESRMSVQISTSEVSAINNAAGIGPVQVSEDTFFVIEESISFAEQSGGKFDISVQPLVELWGIGTEEAGIPRQREIDAALKLIDYRDIVLDHGDRSVFLKRKNMAIDLGGIAKGYAADAVRGYLLERGFSKGIINFGGNVIAFGSKAGKMPWKIGVQDPYDVRGNPMGILKTAGTSVVTSGIYERYFEQEGVIYHHILDTENGYPSDNQLASVTIVTGECIAADAFSTIAFSLGLEAGMDLLERTPDLEGIFVTRDKKVFTTSGLTEHFDLTNFSYTLEN